MYNKDILKGVVGLSDISIEVLRKLCTDETIALTQHLQMRLRERGLRFDDVIEAIMTGETIEQYPTDYPYPSCLVLGETTGKKKMHVVCGVGSGRLWVITAYLPSMEKWEPNGKIRKER